MNTHLVRTHDSALGELILVKNKALFLVSDLGKLISFNVKNL